MNKKTYLGGWRPAGRGYVEQIKDLILARNKGFNKMVELLHKQLIRKGRIRTRSANFYHPTLKAMVYFIRSYDIKSSAKGPYNYHSHNDLGLNQLFVGQNPYSWYDGDPSDGIYHDKVEILCMPRAYASGVESSDNAPSLILAETTGVEIVEVREKRSSGPRYILDYSRYILNDNSYLLFFNHPKSFIDGRRYSLIYKVSRRAEYRHSTSGDGENTGEMIYHYTFHTNRYEQTTQNGKQINKHLGSGSFSYSTHSISTETITSGDRDREHTIIVVNPISTPISYIMANLKMVEILDYQTFRYSVPQSSSKTYHDWSEILVKPPHDNYNELKLTIQTKHNKYTLYPVGAYGNYIILNDGRILENVANINTTTAQKDRIIAKAYLTETFYADNDMPTRGAMKWFLEWEQHYTLFIKEDKGIPAWTGFGVAVFAFVVAYFTGPQAAAWATSAFAWAGAAYIAWAGAILSSIGLFFSIMSGIGLMGAHMAKVGKVFSIVGGVINISTMVSSAWAKVTATAAANASNLSAQSVASSSGLSQTSALYANTGFSNASALGSNLTTSSSVMFNSNSSIMFSSGALSNSAVNSSFSGLNAGIGSISSGLYASGNTMISPLTAIAISQPVGLTTTQIINQSLNLLNSAYKTYSDTRDIFKKPNEFSDDEVPTNDDKPQINYLPMNSQLIMRRHYNISDDYDLGLQSGTLLYIPSVREKIVNLN